MSGYIGQFSYLTKLSTLTKKLEFIRQQTGFEEKSELSPAKIFSVAFIVFFIFIFTKGISVMEKSKTYKYDGPDTTTEERIKRFVK